MMSCRLPWKHGFAMVITYFALAMVNVLIKRMLENGTHHMVIVTYRQVVAAIFLAPIAYFWERKKGPSAKLTASVVCILFFSAFLGITLTQYLFLLGLEHTSASFSCAILNTVPVSTFVLALIFGVERLSVTTKAEKGKILGTFICIGGAVLLILYKGLPLTRSHLEVGEIRTHVVANTISSTNKTKNWVIGSTLLMTSSILWSSWFLIQAKVSKKYPRQFSSTVILAFFAAIQSAAFGLVSSNGNNKMWLLNGKFDILTLIYAGAVGSGLCYVGMSWCVKQRGPVFTAAFTPLMQIFASIFDISFLHEQLYLGSILGSIVVVLGLYILLWGKSFDGDECEKKQVIQVIRDDNGDAILPK